MHIWEKRRRVAALSLSLSLREPIMISKTDSGCEMGECGNDVNIFELCSKQQQSTCCLFIFCVSARPWIVYISSFSFYNAVLIYFLGPLKFIINILVHKHTQTMSGYTDRIRLYIIFLYTENTLQDISIQFDHFSVIKNYCMWPHPIRLFILRSNCISQE